LKYVTSAFQVSVAQLPITGVNTLQSEFEKYHKELKDVLAQERKVMILMLGVWFVVSSVQYSIQDVYK
jgi:hypothetical protein